jgi:hypothetical protein
MKIHPCVRLAVMLPILSIQHIDMDITLIQVQLFLNTQYLNATKIKRCIISLSMLYSICTKKITLNSIYSSHMHVFQSIILNFYM